MQIVRTVIWVLLLVALLLFSIFNWTDVTVTIWENIVVDTKIPAIVIISFLIGFVPMWLYYRGSKWQMRRKIASLENAVRTAAATPVAPAPASDNTGTVDTMPEPVTEMRVEADTDAKLVGPDNPLSPDNDGSAKS